jgi:hypothetical protein
MIKKSIRLIAATITSVAVLVGMTKVGTNLNVLNTNLQLNICMALGVVLIAILNLRIVTEKE